MPTVSSAIANFFRVLTLEQPEAALLTALTERVTNNATTLGATLQDIYQSPSYSNGLASSVARMFFVVFGRAPDSHLYGLAMDALRTGSTLTDIARVALSFPGHHLSNDGLATSQEFVKAIMTRVYGNANNVTQYNALVNMLDQQTMTREQMLGIASTWSGQVQSAPEAHVQTSLIFLAGGNREASLHQLNLTPNLPNAIITSLNAVGLSATAGRMALTVDSGANQVKVYSEIGTDLVWNWSANQYKLGGTSAFKIFLTLDEGLTGSVIDFTRSLVQSQTALDASEAVGKGKIIFTGHSLLPNTFWAPAAGSTAYGGTKDDTFIGNAGTDTFYISAGKDRMTGGAGDDIFVLPTSNTYLANPGSTATITDFGTGKDVLDFTRLLNKSFDISKLVAKNATDTTAAKLTNGEVVLIENNGAWVTGAGVSATSRAATVTDVASLFGPSKVLANPSSVIKSVVITADTTTSADVWLILNSTGVTAITDGVTGPQEIYHIAELNGSWNATLTGVIPAPLNPLL